MTTTARLAGLSARSLEQALEQNFSDGTLASAVGIVAEQFGDSVERSMLEEAATRLAQVPTLLARIAALEAENVRLALLAANGAPVLQQLNTEEQDALVDFIKSLRTPATLNRSENDAG